MAKPLVFVTRRIPEKALEMLRGENDVRLWEDELPPGRDVLLREIKDEG